MQNIGIFNIGLGGVNAQTQDLNVFGQQPHARFISIGVWNDGKIHRSGRQAVALLPPLDEALEELPEVGVCKQAPKLQGRTRTSKNAWGLRGFAQFDRMSSGLNPDFGHNAMH